jgi:hypothetical protein
MKKLLSAAAVAFVLFYVLTQPNSAADAVRAGLAIVGDAADSLVTFVTALFR